MMKPAVIVLLFVFSYTLAQDFKISQYNWSLTDRDFKSEVKPIDLESYPHECIGQPALCAKGFTLVMWVKRILKPNVHDYAYIISSGAQTPLSDGFYLRQNFGKEFELGISLKEQIWRTEFYLQLEDWAQIVITWSAEKGLYLYVDGLLSKKVADPETRLFVPYQIDPFPRILIGLANHQYYTIDNLHHMFAVANVTHMEWFTSVSKRGQFIDLFDVETAERRCVLEQPETPEELTFLKRRKQVNLCRKRCADMDYQYCAVKSGRSCVCFSQPNPIWEDGPKSSRGVCRGWQIYENSHIINKPHHSLDFQVDYVALGENAPQIRPGDGVLFTFSSSGDEPETYHIDFDDGESLVTTDKEISHMWDLDGTYKVVIRAVTRTLTEKKVIQMRIESVDEGTAPEAVRIFSTEKESLTIEHHLVVVGNAPIWCTITIDGDEKVELRDMKSMINERSFVRKYKNPGIYKVDASCSNRFGMSKTSGYSIVRSLEVGQTYLKKGDNRQFTVHNARMLTERSNVNAYIVPGFDYPNPPKPVPVTVIDNKHIQVPRLATLPSGQHVINIDVSGQLLFQHIADIQEKISGLEIKPNKIHTVVDDEIEIEFVVQTGDMVFVMVDYGDGTNEYLLIDETSDTPKFTKTHSYDRLGRYFITMETANDISHSITRKEITIERPVSRLDSRAGWVHDRIIPVVFEVELDKHEWEVIPIVYQFDYKDGSKPELVTSKSTQPGEPFMHQHYYERFGMFDVEITAINNISNVSVTRRIQVGQNITYVDLSTTTEKVVIGEDAEVIISCPTGIPATFTVDFGDDEPPTVVHEPPGFIPYEILEAQKLVIDGGNGSLANATTAQPEIHSRKKRSADQGPTDSPNGGTKSTMRTTTTQLPIFSSYGIRQPAVTVIVKHRYRKEGLFKVSVKVANMFNSAETWMCPKIQVIASDRGSVCNDVSYTIHRKGQNFSEPHIEYRSSRITIRPKVVSDCDGSVKPNIYNWKASKIEEIDGIFVERPALELCESQSKGNALKLLPKQFQYGVYRIQSTLFEAANKKTSWPQEMFVRFVPSPLKAELRKDKSIKMEEVIMDQSIRLQFDDSGDQDEDDPMKGVTLDVFCYVQQKSKKNDDGQDMEATIDNLPDMDEGNRTALYRQFLNESKMIGKHRRQKVRLWDYNNCFSASGAAAAGEEGAEKKKKIEKPSFTRRYINILAKELVLNKIITFVMFVAKDVRTAFDKVKYTVWESEMNMDNALNRIWDLLLSGDTNAAISVISQFSDNLNNDNKTSNSTDKSGKKNMRGALIGVLGEVSNKIEDFDQADGTIGALGKVSEVKDEVTSGSKTKASGALNGVVNASSGQSGEVSKDEFKSTTTNVLGVASNVVPEAKAKPKPSAMFNLKRDFDNEAPKNYSYTTAFTVGMTTALPTGGPFWHMNVHEQFTTSIPLRKETTTTTTTTTQAPTYDNSSIGQRHHQIVNVSAGGEYFATVMYRKDIHDEFGEGNHEIFLGTTEAWPIKDDLVKVSYNVYVKTDAEWIEAFSNENSTEYAKWTSNFKNKTLEYVLRDETLGSLEWNFIVKGLKRGSVIIDATMVAVAPKGRLELVKELLDERLYMITKENELFADYFIENAELVGNPKIELIINPTTVVTLNMTTATAAITTTEAFTTTTTTTTTTTPPPNPELSLPETVEMEGMLQPDDVRLKQLIDRHKYVCWSCGAPRFFSKADEEDSISVFFSDHEIELLESCAEFKGLDYPCLIYYEDPADIRVLVDECLRIEAEVIKMQKEQEKAAAGNVLGALDTVSDVLLQKPPDERPLDDDADEETAAAKAAEEEKEPMAFGSPTLELKLQKMDGNGTENQTLSSESGSFSMPSASMPASNKSLGTKFLAAKKNPFSWSDNSDSVKSGVVSISYVDDEGNPLSVSNTSEPISIKLKGDPENAPEERNFTVYGQKKINYHRVQLTQNDSSLHLVLKPNNIYDRFRIYMKYKDFPNITYNDYYDEVPHIDHDFEETIAIETVNGTSIIDNDLIYTVFPPVNLTALNGSYVIGVQLYETKRVLGEGERNHTYTFRAFTSGCRYWNEQNETWDAMGCEVGPKTTIYETECLCTHLTSFGGDFVVPPNTIDFNTVWAKFKDLDENAAVFSTVVTILLLYFIVIIWCRIKDKEDILKWGAAPLEDNLPTDEYHYMLAVSTGVRKNAGTDSKVSFIMSGDNTDSGVRCLSDGKRKGFHRGEISNYVMSCERSLGPLNYMRIWHDNTGKGERKGWYLDQIEVTDLQTGRKSFFLGGKWLAVEKGDGMVERILPVAGLKDLAAFNQLFSSSFRKKMTSDHLWVSVVSRPTRSSFTRVQRVSCCLSLLFLTMIANAMFFKGDEKMENVSVIRLGPFTFTMSMLYISVMSTCIVFPPSMFVVTIFKKCKPKTNAIDQLIKKKKHAQKYKWKQMDNSEFFSDMKKRKSRMRRFKDGITNILNFHQKRRYAAQEQEEIAIREGVKKKKSSWHLPHWCIWFGWFICIASVFVPAFFVILYSMEWGKEKANEWLVTFLLSFFQDVVLVQPIKVLLFATFISMIMRKPEFDDDEDDDDNNAAFGQDEEGLNGEGGADGGDVSVEQIMLRREMAANTLKPPDMAALSQQRELRMKEMKMEEIIKEVIIYFIFVLILFFLSYQVKSMDSYRVYDDLQRMFVNINPSIEEVNTPDDFWQWAKEGLLPNLYAPEWYNGRCLNWREAMHTVDRHMFRVGVSRFRQLRVKNDTCTVNKKFEKVIDHCRDAYGWIDDDAKEYLEGWNKPKDDSELPDQKTPWMYQGSVELRSLPYMGTYKLYKGGGYAVDLARTHRESKRIIAYLEQNRWLDPNTRAVFTEFNLYNVHVNLFASVIMLVEFLETGGAVARVDLKIFRLFSYVGSFAIVVILFQLVALGFIIYFTYLVVKGIIKLKWKYFKDFWNLLDFVSTVCCVVSVVMFGFKQIFTHLAITALKESGSTEYVNFVTLAQYEEIYGYVSALVVFISTLKLIKLLKFNKRMGALGDTIRRACGDLKVFTIAFAFYFFAFCLWGYMLFGRYIAEYGTFVGTMEALFAFALGSFDFGAMSGVHAWLGPLYFFMYVMVVYILMMSIFMVIINESVTAVKEDSTLLTNEYEIVDFIWKRFKALFGRK